MKEISLEDRIYLEKNGGDYGSYIIHALDHLAKNGFKVMSIQKVAEKVMAELPAPTYDPTKDNWDQAQEIISSLPQRLKEIEQSIPHIKYWTTIMGYVSYGESDYNSVHPGIDLGIQQYWETYGKILEKMEMHDSEFFESFCDTATYIYDAPESIFCSNKWKIPSIIDGKVYKNKKELEKMW